jgi:hypothetical protein
LSIGTRRNAEQSAAESDGVTGRAKDSLMRDREGLLEECGYRQLQG